MDTFPTWIRLHPSSVDETLAIAVQARLHDPLWLLGRQWQFGELRHDGGATPVDVRVEGAAALFARLRGGGPDVTTGRSTAITATGTPLEALVEREAVREQGMEQLRLRSEAGLHLLRMLRAAGLAEARVAFWIAESAFSLPADAVLDEESRAWWEMVEGRIPDGARLPSSIRARLAAGGGTPTIDDAEATVLRAWMSWAADRFEQPASGPATWSPEHLEYAFSVAAPGASGEVLLTAPEYVDGKLEWYHFEQGSGTLGVTGQPAVRRAFRVPAPLDFAGMPNPRFWTFEDRSVQFELIDVLANPDVEPSPATMMVLDFALSYSDDWFLVPIALDAWSLFDVTAVAVTDVFGDVTMAAQPAGRWNLFRLDVDGQEALSNVFVTACPADAIEGPAIEEVHFLADEAVNVAWGVERRVPHPIGPGVDVPAVPPPAAAQTPSGLVWTLTPPPPPGNWFPLLPTTVGRLALGALWSSRTQRPSGQVLGELRASRRSLHQSEVPPEGAQVTRRWQSARAIDGSLHFWVGRSKTPRLTDTAPAVRFDVVEYRQK